MTFANMFLYGIAFGTALIVIDYFFVPGGLY